VFIGNLIITVNLSNAAGIAVRTYLMKEKNESLPLYDDSNFYVTTLHSGLVYA